MATPITGETKVAPGGKTPPGPRGGMLLGSVRDFRRDSLGFLADVARRYGDVTRYRMANMTWYQVNHPEGVRRILQQNNHNYGKGTLTKRVIGPISGEGLFTSEGETWLRQRRLMQPVFHRQRVAAFGELMTGATLAMLDRWEPLVDAGTSIDLPAEMARLTLDIATETLFSSHVGEEPDVIARAVTTLISDVSFRFEVPYYPPVRVPTPYNRRVRSALRTLDRAVYRIIEERRRVRGGGDDLLALLMDARDEETGEAMGDKQLRDEVITLFIAGHETTANALAWTFYLLARNPEAEHRLQTELASALGTNGSTRPPAVADLPQLPYTRMVVEETMRLYPPAWITNRQAHADDEILGYHIPAGAFVMISPYVLHRHPAYWKLPEKFDPERFSPEHPEDRPRYAYFPFGGGPRQCIGKDMALVEARLILATVAGRYRLRLVHDRPVEPEALATLRPHGGLPMIPEGV
ncbi:cytochrome P450 [soil metagenome]